MLALLATDPAGAANLDMSVSGDGKYPYTLNSGLGTIGVYGINFDGTLAYLGEIDGLLSSVGFNGIAALYTSHFIFEQGPEQTTACGVLALFFTRVRGAGTAWAHASEVSAAMRILVTVCRLVALIGDA